MSSQTSLFYKNYRKDKTQTELPMKKQLISVPKIHPKDSRIQKHYLRIQLSHLYMLNCSVGCKNILFTSLILEFYEGIESCKDSKIQEQLKGLIEIQI